MGLFLISFCGQSQQDFSNFRIKKIPISDSVQVDSLSIIPGSLKTNMDSNLYQVNYFKGYILFKKKNLAQNKSKKELDYKPHSFEEGLTLLEKQLN